MAELTAHGCQCNHLRMIIHAEAGELGARRIADEIRAEMARQRRTANELSSVLEISQHTTGRRLNGAQPFNVIELLVVAEWLGITLVELIARSESPKAGSRWQEVI